MSNARVILDTNIVSYLMRGGAFAEAYAPHVQGKLLAIAFITVGEMYFGAEHRNWGERKRKELETTLRNFVVIPYGRLPARAKPSRNDAFRTGAEFKPALVCFSPPLTRRPQGCHAGVSGRVV